MSNSSKLIKIFGTHDQNTIDQMNLCLDAHDSARYGVIAADGHKGYAQNIGGVIAYKNAISVSGVGFDIACGNLAIKTDLQWKGNGEAFQKNIADAIAKEISFGVGSSPAIKVDHPLFDDDAWKIPAFADLKDKARSQLSSCGSGNHYCDVFYDENNTVWVGVHFGSRGLGHGIATDTLKKAGAKDGMDVEPCVLDEGSALGAEYLEGMRLAGLYAYAGREFVARHIVQKILGASIVEEIHNHHNYAWKENHFGEDFWVVRKGATPAFPGQKGFVGGSMGDISVILRGVDSQKSREALYSTVHGAGRVMSRTEAAGKVKWVFDPARGTKVPKRITAGKVDEGTMRTMMVSRGIELRGAGADEAPQVYRPLGDVLKAHEGTIEVLHTLKPVVVVMAGAVWDPYKD
jgi:tRNA-splicing ligase RtcB (3'-phosphate/5'-hydroxy nucleic acid ligase)